MAVSEQIDDYLHSLPAWQRENLQLFRKLIHKVAPQVEEGWKWDVPVFLFKGKLVCAMSSFKEHTKYNFFTGAQVEDKHGLFNSGLDSKKHRSINVAEGEKIAEEKLKELLTAAFNLT